MKQSERKDAAALAGIAVAVLGAVVGTQAGRWLNALADLARRPVALVLASGAIGALVVLVAARWLVSRRLLARRVRFAIVPADSFDPSEEAVVRFASVLSRSRRALRGLLETPGSAVRVQLDADHEGRLRYAIEVPAHAREALRVGVGGYEGVELREAPTAASSRTGRAIARAELVLARPSAEPLRAAGLDPDPLAGFARALGALRSEDGGTAAVCVDLLALTAAQRRRLRRRLLRRARRQGSPTGALVGLGAGSDRGRMASAELVARRAGQRALTAKLGSPEPLFAVQVLIRASAPTAGQAKASVAALLAAFDAFAGENHFRAVGRGVPALAFLGSDMPIRRRRFDRRFATGLFGSARRRLVTATEIAGLLKPPTAKCPAPNVLRSGEVIPPPPPGLPAFRGQDEMLPLGRIVTEAGERMVGVPVAETFFTYMAGRSRYGKTETAIGQFLHLARAGHGCFFLDPHEDAIRKIKTYLTTEGLRERVVEINLADRDTDRQPGWNLFAAQGQPPDHAHERVDAVADAFASALGWDERNTRALNLTAQAAQALTELAQHLPHELAPTVFQIPTLLGDDDWRTAVLRFVSPATRQFFTQRFPRLPADAITPVTNLIDRLRVAPAVAALLGSPTSTYDIRKAMDRKLIVLACPGSGSARDRLVANFLVYDLLHAAKGRAALAPARRTPFFAFFDEVQTYDGASSGNLAALLEQTAKYGVRAFLFNQNPERLTAATLNAVTTNRSHLLTTALNAKAAALLTREWGRTIEPEAITNLRRYTFLASVTFGCEVSPPFLVHGASVEDLLPDQSHPDELASLDAAIDHSTHRRPVQDTLAALDEHDRRILDHLRRSHSPRRRQRHSPQRAISAERQHGRRTLDVEDSLR